MIELNPDQLETFRGILIGGYVWDGDVVSKKCRDELVKARFLQRQSGYNFLTFQGIDLAITLGLLDS